MKRNKIVLTLVTVLTITGGLLAFKAARTNIGTFYTFANGACTAQFTTLTTASGGSLTTLYYNPTCAMTTYRTTAVEL